MRKQIFTGLFVGIGMCMHGQDFPVFSQYLYNRLLLNPAVAGSDGALSADLFYRNQWMGIAGAPVFQTAAMHTPVKKTNAGIGLLLLNEKRYVFRQQQGYLNYAYCLSHGDKHLAFGLRAGLHYLNVRWQNIVTVQPDAVFDDAVPSVILPNFGIGVLYYTAQYFIGLSVPYLLHYVSSVESNQLKAVHSMTDYSYLLNWGFSIRGQGIRIQPSMLLKYNHSAGEQIDVNVMAYLLNEKLGIGNSLRLHDAYVLLADYQITPQLRTGFCYDFPVAPLSRFSSGSIEFVLRYLFCYRIYSPNPRYL